MPDFTNLTVRRNPLRMEVEKNGKTLQVNQLSDGEKCLMAIVGDIARRLAIANPKLKNPLEGEGIILIDEIDLHLHPKWQRVVVSQLNNVFKNCQFIISTHSPHVVTHVKKENLFLISSKGNDLKVIKPQESYGKTIERILEDIMGLETTRPEAVNSSIRKIYDQIHLNELKLALDLINDLENEIGSDPELAKARSLIKRKEFINK
jgi:predicted ATP-binding protein involved in virulence